MISAKITADLALLQASVTGAAPLATATPLMKAALVLAGAAVVAEIQTALPLAAGSLDLTDPIGFPGDLVNYFMGLCNAANDQSTLADMRGTVGRAVFNLGQA